MIDETGKNNNQKDSAVITFLIGNGFDIGLGLNTSYKDFLSTYLKQPSKTKIIEKLKQTISRDISLWGDAELAFGKLRFSSLGTDSYSVVSDCLQDFNTALSEYLQKEEKRFVSPSEELQRSFCSGLCSYYLVLGDYPTRNELRRLTRFNSLKVNIVNFNYTETIDKLIPPSGTIALPKWGNVHVQINDICHVHGALSVGQSRLFGVNTIAQVEDADLSSDSKALLVKPEVDRLARFGLEPMAKDMIDESDTVILFGLSLGASDQLWWDYLLDYIQYKPEHRLCLMQHVKKARSSRLPGEEGLWAQHECERFYDAIEPQKRRNINTKALDRRIYVSTRGPHHDPDGQETFCDPFHLAWFGKKLVTGYNSTTGSSSRGVALSKIIESKGNSYCSPEARGTFTFDYSNNNGEYVIGEGDAMFRTRWSKASNTSIHAYKDGKGIVAIALLKNAGEIESIHTIEGDFSSRVRTPRIGDAIVWKNEKDKYAITKIVSIKDDTRGDDHDSLTCDYLVFG